MKKPLLSLSAIGFLMLTTTSLLAQQTGIWDHNFSFNGRTEHITFNVPANYNPSKKYQLFICLMGQGYTTQQYAGTSIGVGFYTNGAFGDVIMAVPGEGQQNSTYAFPAGEDDGIVDATYAQAISLYNIDPKKVYLQGFSFGAHVALKEGLKNPSKYKALMIFSDAPGLADTNGDQTLSDQELNDAYNYPAINQVAVCMAIGGADQNKQFSIAVASRLYAASGNKWTKLNEVPNMGHVPPSQSLALGAYNCVNSIIISGQNELENELEMSLYPNPSNGLITISLPLVGPEKYDVAVFDVTGRRAMNTSFTSGGEHTINLSNQHKGIYFVRIETGSSVLTKKIILTE